MVICSACGEEKPLEEMSKHKGCPTGYSGVCRKCASAKSSQWYKDNQERRHREATLRNRARKAEVVERFGDRCADCEKSYPQCVYQFHHLDPTQKDVNPSKAMTWGYERMWEELNKCVMLCANCHTIRHHAGGSET